MGMQVYQAQERMAFVNSLPVCKNKTKSIAAVCAVWTMEQNNTLMQWNQYADCGIDPNRKPQLSYDVLFQSSWRSCIVVFKRVYLFISIDYSAK